MKTSGSTSLTVATSKPADILACPTISQQIKEHGSQAVFFEISQYVERCALAIGVELSNAQLTVLVEDLKDMYRYDALEDLREALKKGRRGQYGYGMHNRRTLTLPLIQEWMQKQLEEKSRAREERHQKRKDEADKTAQGQLSDKAKQLLQEFYQRIDSDRKKVHQNYREQAEENARERKARKITARTYREKTLQIMCKTWSESYIRQCMEQEIEAELKEVLNQELKSRS